MTGLSPDVFVLANRGFAGGQMAFRPAFYATVSDQQKAIARMQSQSVPFVIIALEEEAGFRGALPLVAAYVDGHYDPLTHIAVADTRGLQILVERGQTRARSRCRHRVAVFRARRLTHDSHAARYRGARKRGDSFRLRPQGQRGPRSRIATCSPRLASATSV